MPYLRTPFSRENNDFTMIIFLIIHETNIYTLQIFLFNKLTKSRQNLYRKPQTRDTFLPKIRPQVSIHLRHRNLSPSSLLLSLSLSRDLVRSHVRHANVPSFHHFLPRLARPLFQDTGSVLFPPPIHSSRKRRGEEGTKDTVKGVRLRAGGGGKGWRLETRPTPYRGGSFLSVDWKKERGCAKPSPPPPPLGVLDSC